MASVHTTVPFQVLIDLKTGWYAREILCATQEGKGLVVSGTERHECQFVVRTHTYVRLRKLWVFITRENAWLASLTHLTKKWFPLQGERAQTLNIFMYIRVV